MIRLLFINATTRAAVRRVMNVSDIIHTNGVYINDIQIVLGRAIRYSQLERIGPKILPTALIE